MRVLIVVILLALFMQECYLVEVVRAAIAELYDAFGPLFEVLSFPFRMLFAIIVWLGTMLEQLDEFIAWLVDSIRNAF